MLGLTSNQQFSRGCRVVFHANLINFLIAGGSLRQDISQKRTKEYFSSSSSCPLKPLSCEQYVFIHFSKGFQVLWNFKKSPNLSNSLLTQAVKNPKSSPKSFVIHFLMCPIYRHHRDNFFSDNKNKTLYKEFKESCICSKGVGKKENFEKQLTYFITTWSYVD